MRKFWQIIQFTTFAFMTQWSFMSAAQAKGVLPELENMPTLSAQAEQAKRPILLLFSAEWCEYCELLQEYVLNPMQLSGLYDDYVFLRHVGIDIAGEIVDWQGRKFKDKAAWAYHLNADLTPTVLFVDGQGREIAQRIVGISEVTLFPLLVHERLNDAYKNLGLELRIPSTPEKLELLQHSNSNND